MGPQRPMACHRRRVRATPLVKADGLRHLRRQGVARPGGVKCTYLPVQSIRIAEIASSEVFLCAYSLTMCLSTHLLYPISSFFAALMRKLKNEDSCALAFWN